MPKLSVIVPVYNSEEHIENCINSVLFQTFHDFEIILVNDGSTDSSITICQNYELNNSKIKLINQRNSGVSIARNNGLKLATGEWIYFMDSDDTINQNLFRLLENVDASTEIIQFGYNKIEIDESKFEYLPLNNLSFDNADEFIRISDYHTFTVWCHFIKRSLISDNNIYFTENQNYAEDLEFIIKAYCCASKISTVNFLGYNYYVYNNSAMSRAYTFENAQLHLNVASHLIEFCIENNIEIGPFIKSRLQYMIKSFFSYSLNCKVSKKKIANEFYKYITNSKHRSLDYYYSNSSLIIAKYNIYIYLLLMELKIKILSIKNHVS